MMKISERIKAIFIILTVLVVSGAVSGVLYSLYYESPPVYRPMVFYDGKLFWDKKIADININSAEYIGTVNSCVSDSEKPTKEIECNCEIFMNAKLYRDDSGNYYIYCTNENILLLDY